MKKLHNLVRNHALVQPNSSVPPVCIWSPWQQCWMPICLSLTDSFVGKNKSPVRINNELYICNVSRFEMRRDSASCQSWLGQNQTRIGKVVAIACSMLWMSDCLRSTDCFVGKNESPIPIIYDIYKGTGSRFKENRNWASSQFLFGQNWSRIDEAVAIFQLRTTFSFQNYF